MALTLRLLYFSSIRHAYFFEHLQTEPLRYDAWARAILRGLAPARPPFDEAPAYPYLIAAVYALVGRSVAAVVIVQATLDAASCAAIAVVARRLSGPGAGWIAGTLAAFYGPLIYFTGQLEPATLAVFTVAVALAATPGPGASGARWIAAGAGWAGAILVRSELAVALGPLALHAVACGGRRALSRVAAAPALLLAASLAVNAASSGHLVILTTGAGVNLWLGNNPESDGVNPFLHGALGAVARDVEAQAHDPVEADALFRARAGAFIQHSPARAARLALRKVLWTWSDRELPNAADIEWQTRQSWLFRPPWFPLRLAMVLPLALTGALLLGRAWRRAAILLAPVAVAVLTTATFFTNARFRLVMAPSLLVLAALGIAGLRALGSGWRAEAAPRGGATARAPVLAAVGLAAGLAVAWWNFDGVRDYAIPQIAVNTAVLERGAGDLSAAIDHFRYGVGADPGDGGAWVQLANTLEQAGRIEEARATWRQALAALPDDATVRRMAGRASRRIPQPP